MKRSVLFLLLLIAIGSSCSSARKTINTQAAAEVSANNDGSSFEKAVVIRQDHERQGIADEYAWIRARYPGSKTKSQALSYNNKKSYDIIHIVTDDGKEVAVYFDISNFYGKF